MAHVFVYGTLLEPTMMQAVVGRLVASQPATLLKYVRSQLTGCYYPGMVPSDYHQVTGAVYCDLTDAELARLDYFEGPEYLRATVQPVLGESNQVVSAEAYLLQPSEQSRMLHLDWDVQHFRQSNLQEFLEVARATMRRYESGDAASVPPHGDSTP
ncbi:gamma-glutamylcyclotransferase family protein [Aeoliella mucimassa]|uniref:Putative gamma-glutamylcyclotransferase n=1 Tax=Aeoliella mucimassa TaxID=2527972 RepID=A0A518AJ37_9BACT|nr:gamma-glutamylcyclotransferase family protein [Aeoliella mucimassa]QDU54741.1 AIG2-like family protein [Aeoliella mucimassa]